MYISYNWLKDFVKIPAKIKPVEVAAALTSHTVEVEGLTRQAERFDKVVVGRVLEVNPHPNADRLRLTVVDVKTKKLDIVCGAPNVAAGQLVPVALVGATLPNGATIAESLIRGEKSCGMICAEDELGLGDNHEGIMVLGEKAKVGEPFAKYLKVDDVIFEVDNKSLSNRPDLLNHYGLARELAAIFERPLAPYEKFYQIKWDFPAAKEAKFSVTVEESDLCPRYLAVRVDNIKVEESPAWLKERLVAIGQRPVNNIVDLTNYVMFDCGQPLHAFAADNIKKIVVRRANRDEVLETLDEKERTLGDEDLVISDGAQALAVAGAMGGLASAIKPATTSLILEAANFSAAAIRRTAQRLNLRTEASVRFEKSLDPNLAPIALFRFLTLLKKLCPTLTLGSPLIDIDKTKAADTIIDLDLNWLTDKIGQDLPRATVVDGLRRLGFAVANDASAPMILKVTVPSWRATKDIARPEDLAEEVLRLYGYDAVPSRLPVLSLSVPEINEERRIERRVKEILALRFALNEVYNYSFVGEETLKKLDIDFFQHLKLINPLAGTQSLLRQSLVPGLVGNVKTNQFKSEAFGFFEIGSVFFNAPGRLPKDSAGETFLPYQEKRLGLALAGSGNLFGNLKGVVAGLLVNLHPDLEIEYAEVDHRPGWADASLAAKIMVGGEALGIVAGLSVTASREFNLKLGAVFAEINFTRLAEIVLSRPAFRFQEAPKYPPVRRDVAFVVSEEILYNNLKREMIGFSPLIRSVELFDIYIGDKLPARQKSLAFHIVYRSDEKTLTAVEVDKLQQDLIDRLAKKFNLHLRDF